MASSFASTSSHVDSAPVPNQTPEDSRLKAAPKKKTPRSAALTGAKNVLRAATAATSKSLAAPSARRSPAGRGPQFIHRPPDLARHRRKCAICHHPEREAIEDLFVHWHSPEAIASHYDDYEQEDESITWISIYRHAYAFGLDEIRCRNLRFVFEHILDQAGTTAATPASIIVAARALASYVNENGAWNEPPKRVIVTNIIRNEPPQTTERISGGQSFSSDNDNDDEFSSDRALHPREVVPSAGEGDVPASAPPAFVEADRLHRPAPSQRIDRSSAADDGVSRDRDFAGADFVHRPAPSEMSPEIRNSLNSFKFKEPPISNR